MQRAILAVLFVVVVAGCGSSGSGAPKEVVIATSSTTAEEALAIDGPVMRYPHASSPSGNLETLLAGVLQLEGGCLYLVQDSIGQRYPILWPAGTQWDGQNQSVVSPVGETMPMGGPVTGRGGYFYLSDIHLLGGAAASNLAAQCLGNTSGQVAVVKNSEAAIGPKTG